MATHAANTLAKAKKAVHLCILGIIDTDTVGVYIREMLHAKKAAEQGPAAAQPKLCLYPVFDRSPLDLHKDFDLILTHVSHTDPSPNSFKALASALRDKYRPQYAAASLVHTDDRALNEMATDPMRAKVLRLKEAEDTFRKRRAQHEADARHMNEQKFRLDEAEQLRGKPNAKGESQMKRLKTMHLNAQKTHTESLAKARKHLASLDVQLTGIVAHKIPAPPSSAPPAMAQPPLPSAQPIVCFTPETLKKVEAEHDAALSAKLLDEQAKVEANRELLEASAAFEKAKKALEEKRQAFSQADRKSSLSAREESAVSDRHKQLLMLLKRRAEGPGRD
jgi:hypothetical protein